MAKTKEPAPTADVPVQAPQPDPYHGVGGTYVLDPKTGERRQVEPPTRNPKE